MKNSLLIEAYQAFTSRELREFSLFLASPWFNQSELICTLHDNLARIWPDFTPGQLEKTVLFEALYPGQPYDDRKIRVLMSKLLTLIQQFWTQKSLKARPLDQKKLLLDQLKNRNVTRIYGRSIRETLQWLEEEGKELDDYFFEKFLLSELETQYQIEFQGQRVGGSTVDPLEPIAHLDHYYIIQKLRFLCVANTLASIRPGSYQAFLESELLDSLTDTQLEVPLIALYRQILFCLREADDPTHFSHFRSLLSKYQSQVSAKLGRELYNYAQNYCVRKINRGENDYLSELFDLYREGIESGMLLINAQLSPWMYKNIAVTGLRLGEFDWIGSFLDTYKEMLPEEERENAYTYNLAKYHFYRQNYSEVIRLLMKVEYNDVFYGLDSRAMLLKTYFELNEVEALDSLAQSFRIFLRRKKSISDNYRKGYLNFIKFIKKLLRPLSLNPKQLQQLEAEVKATQPMMDIGWLLDKLHEMQ